jgi:hypothetical protein
MDKKLTASAISATALDARDAAQGVIGKKCWRVAFGYPQTLHLHLGAHIPYENAKMGEKRQGSWRFGTCGTAWTILTQKGTISSREKDQLALEKKVKVLEKSTIIRFRVTGRLLTITFSNGCRLRITPTAEDDQYDIPYWELFLPKHRLVTHGPCKVWSYRRSDLPTNA